MWLDFQLCEKCVLQRKGESGWEKGSRAHGWLVSHVLDIKGLITVKNKKKPLFATEKDFVRCILLSPLKLFISDKLNRHYHNYECDCSLIALASRCLQRRSAAGLTIHQPAGCRLQDSLLLAVTCLKGTLRNLEGVHRAHLSFGVLLTEESTLCINAGFTIASISLAKCVLQEVVNSAPAGCVVA